MKGTRNALPYVLARQIDDGADHCRRLVEARFRDSKNLYRKDLLSHYGCVNAIEFSNQGDLLVSGGDDRRVVLWKVEQSIQGKGKPIVMKAQHDSNIFCLGYDGGKTKIFSAGNDDQVIVHNLHTGEPLNFFLHEKPVYGLSIHPHNDNVFSSACDDGRVLIYDIRGSSSKESFCLAQYKSAFHSVMYNPIEPNLLATANAKEGVSMWDVRKPLEPLTRYGSEGPARSCMYVRFNKAGNRLLALRRRLPPVLYSTESSTHLCQFDHPGYYNSCTMKSCCFAGADDEYILSGSDDFKLYMWRIPGIDVKWVDSAHMVLKGHRSIVNQVRYNEKSCVLASSGVEKIIKIWSPFPLGSDYLGGLKGDDGRHEKQRRIFTHDEYIRLVLRSGEFMTHDYSHQSTREDPRMMAFFDSLVQREIQDWSSEDMATPQSPSDATPQTNFSDSDEDPAMSHQQIALNILGARDPVRSTSGGVAPERASKSPNIITRLIATHREKLMKLAAIEGGVCFEKTPKSRSPEGENGAPRRRKKRARAARAEAEGEKVDAVPSTSTGVTSRRPRYDSESSDDSEYDPKAKRRKMESCPKKRAKMKQRRPGEPAQTPDSGIASENLASTVEKRGDSDEASARKSLESFRKRVDVAKRGYRMRSSNYSSDSSD